LIVFFALKKYFNVSQCAPINSNRVKDLMVCAILMRFSRSRHCEERQRRGNPERRETHWIASLRSQ
tara:strand:- start:797 stop:994 length:198 start_codon:yes stop_codon:yes gene_type:complete